MRVALFSVFVLRYVFYYFYCFVCVCDDFS